MIFLGLAENSIQLVPDGTIFLHIAIILGMIFVLNQTLYKPINRVLEERERRTRGRSDDAKGILRRVEQAMTDYENALRAARAEGYRMMEQERAQALQERQGRLTALREEVTGFMESEKQTIRTQTKEARKTLKTDARQIAQEIGAHILHRPISDRVASEAGLQS
jgi:F-type H+-transporting ATPase subunit b